MQHYSIDNFIIFSIPSHLLTVCNNTFSRTRKVRIFMDKEKMEARLDSYLEHCQYEKALNAHTLKAYKKDIGQFICFSSMQADPFSKENIQSYIAWLHDGYAARSVKRKIASLKAFFAYLSFEGALPDNPLLIFELNCGNQFFFLELSHSQPSISF